MTKALHPFGPWFWNRDAVYKAFGFDRFLSEERMPPLKKRGLLASDVAFTDEIIRQAELTKDPFFFFAVTLQGHGPYPPNRYPDANHKVDARMSDWAKGSTLSYAEGIADADAGLKRLIDWASKRERKTVIAFFGDHLPPLGPVYVETGFMKEPVASRRAPVGEMSREHETPLVVWSNRGGTVKDIGAISPAFVPLHVLRSAGIKHPYYTGFLGRMRNQFRVIDRNMLIGADGEAFPDWARRKEIDPAISNFRLLQYDMMFGDRDGTWEFFPEIEATSGSRLKQPAAVRHLALNRRQHHRALVVGEAERQHLRHELADLARREVDDRRHLPADQRLRAIVFGDLRRRFLDADLGPEIDLQLERRLARLRKRLGLDDGAGADVDAIEIGKADLGLALAAGRHRRRSQALPNVSNSTLASASLAGTPDQTTNWNAWK